MLTNGPYGPINTAILLDTYMKAYDNACGMIVNMQQIIEQIRDGKGDALKIDDNVLKLLSGEKELSEVTLPESKIPKEELQKKITKVDAPQFIRDTDGNFHWNTGKYDYISYFKIQYVNSTEFDNFCISHNEPIVVKTRDDRTTLIELPKDYEILEGEIRNNNITHINYAAGYITMVTPDGTSETRKVYRVWPDVPTDYVRQTLYDIEMHKLIYKGNVYYAQNNNPSIYQGFAFILTENGLWQIVSENVYSSSESRLSYDALTGVLESYMSDGTTPHTFDVYQHNVNTGKIIARNYNATSVNIGKNLLKISTNMVIYSAKVKILVDSYIVNDFNDYVCNIGIDAVPTEGSTNLISSGAVYKYINDLLAAKE